MNRALIGVVVAVAVLVGEFIRGAINELVGWP